jgi:hypothetical protein
LLILLLAIPNVTVKKIYDEAELLAGWRKMLPAFRTPHYRTWNSLAEAEFQKFSDGFYFLNIIQAFLINN